MSQISSLEDAVTAAELFVQKYYPLRRLMKAEREDSTWLVEFDVGALVTTIVRMRLDVDSGTIVEYTMPDAK